MEYNKKCLYCEKEYTAKRSDSKTCSSSCRVNFSFLVRNSIFLDSIVATPSPSGFCTYNQSDLDRIVDVGNTKLGISRYYLQWDKKQCIIRVYGVGKNNKKSSINNSNKQIYINDYK